MKPGGGKAKGSAFERLIRNKLTAAYYPDGDGEFQRIYSRPIPKKGETRGDLQALRYIKDGEDKVLIKDSAWPFVVECKHYAKIKHIFSGLWSKESEIYDWMDQASVVAKTEGKIPLVIFRLNGSSIMVVMDNQDGRRLEFIFGIYKHKLYHFMRTVPFKDLVIFDLDDFLKWLDFCFFKAGAAARHIRSIVEKEDTGVESKG